LVEVKPETREFIPYGTPCAERFDPATQTLEILQCEIETLQRRLSAMVAARDAQPAPAKRVTKIAAAKSPRSAAKRGAVKQVDGERS
jgi:serine O-acetyltransferase